MEINQTHINIGFLVLFVLLTIYVMRKNEEYKMIQKTDKAMR